MGATGIRRWGRACVWSCCCCCYCCGSASKFLLLAPPPPLAVFRILSPGVTLCIPHATSSHIYTYIFSLSHLSLSLSSSLSFPTTFSTHSKPPYNLSPHHIPAALYYNTTVYNPIVAYGAYYMGYRNFAVRGCGVLTCPACIIHARLQHRNHYTHWHIYTFGHVYVYSIYIYRYMYIYVSKV